MDGTCSIGWKNSAKPRRFPKQIWNVRELALAVHTIRCVIQENQIKATRGNRVKWYILHRRCENVCVRWTTIGKQKEREREKLIRFYFQTCRPVPCSIADEGLHQHPSSDVYNIHVLLHIAFVSTGRHFSLPGLRNKLLADGDEEYNYPIEFCYREHRSMASFQMCYFFLPLLFYSFSFLAYCLAHK